VIRDTHETCDCTRCVLAIPLRQPFLTRCYPLAMPEQWGVSVRLFVIALACPKVFVYIPTYRTVVYRSRVDFNSEDGRSFTRRLFLALKWTRVLVSRAPYRGPPIHVHRALSAGYAVREAITMRKRGFAGNWDFLGEGPKYAIWYKRPNTRPVTTMEDPMARVHERGNSCTFQIHTLLHQGSLRIPTPLLPSRYVPFNV
jgi:hypothetical protein